MTNAELLSKIKAEIERRHNYEKEMYCDTKPDGRPNNGWAESLAIMGVLEELLSFLSTLESEKPTIPDDLDNEVHRFFDECIEVYEVPLYGKVKERVITVDCYEITARHFAQWGAKRQAEQLLKSSPPPEDTVLFNKGVEEGKRLMMEDAVEGYVGVHLTEEGTKVTVNSGYLPKEFDIKNGDKVRIIVIPNTDEK